MRKFKFVFLATMLIVNSIFGIIPGVMADGKNESEYENEIELTNDHIKDFSFKVNDDEFVENQTNVRNGDRFQLKIDFIDKIEHDDNNMNFGPGTVLKYQLPENFTQHFTGLSVPENFGTPPNYIGELQIDADNGFVTITLNDNIKEGVTIKDIEKGTFTISGNFSNDNDQWDKEINMPKGEKFNVNFVPKQDVGTAIDKSVKANKNGQKSDELHWTVIVNTNRTITDSADDNPVFTDELSSSATGHRYKEDSVEIREIPITPQGVGKPSQQTTSPIAGPTFENNGQNDTENPKMNITLEKGKAYEIKYTTIPNNPGINESVTYKNEADYAGNKDDSSTTVDFGKAIEKTTSGPNPSTLITDWTIKYNGNEQVIPSGTKITDSWTTGGTTQTGSQKLVDNQGNIAPANATSYVEITRPDGGQAPQYTVAYNENDEKFELTLGEEINYPIEIKYKTKPEGFIASENFTVTNKADHGHIETEAEKTVTYRQTSLTLSKDRNGKGINNLNYEDKTMEWRIIANQAGYDLKTGDKFIDEFTNENMKLVDGTLEVTIGGNDAVAETDYKLTDNGTKGFEIELLKDTSSRIVITYKTSFDQIKDVNEDRSKNYLNKVTLVADNLPTDPTANSTYNSNNSQKANGSKDGSYNYGTKEFTWEIVFNYNSNTLTNAILKDELPGEHEITEATLEKGHISSGGEFVADETLTADITGSNSFELDLGKIEQPHRLVYKTKMKSDVMPVDGEKNYTVTNNAELYDGNDKNAGWKKNVEVKHSKNVLDQKNGAQVGNTETIKWNFLYNTAQSKLTDVVISDTFVDDKNSDIPRNQLINEESLKVYKVTYTGTTPNNPTENKTEIDRSEYDLKFNKDGATFVLEFKEIDYPIYVEYESMFIGLDGSQISNELGVTYNDGDDQEDDTRKPITNFTYDAFASTSAGEFVIVKTDEATGEPLPGVEFTLKNRNGKKLLSGTTDKDGVLDFGMPFATGTYYLDEENQEGYEELKDFEIKLTANGVLDGPYEGKQVVNVTNIKTKDKDKLCPNFTVLINNVDGDPQKQTVITLENNSTGKKHEATTNPEGKVTFKREDLPAGKYTVIKGVDSIGEVTVKYSGNCDDAIVVQPPARCDDFTLTLTDKENEGLQNIEVTLKDKDTDGKKISVTSQENTNTDGEVSFSTQNLPAGKYKVYNGEVLLGEITVSYLNGACTTGITLEVTDPTCENCTIKILKSNGKPFENTKVVIKKGTDANGDKVSDDYFTTNINGEIDIANNLIKAGVTYTVYELNEDGSERRIGTFKIDDKCTVEVREPSTGGGGTPGEDEDGEDEEKPSTPEKVELPPKVEEIIKDSPEPDKVKLQPIKDNRKDGEKIPVNEDGTIDLDSLTPGTYDFVVVYDGEKEDGSEDLLVGKMKITVDDDGNVTVEEELIDPYGKITDKETGEIVGGVHLEIIYADTKRNRDKGREPYTRVPLPEVPNFPPNKNHNPQTSVDEVVWNDEANDYGNYGWLVFPEGDYQIVAKKPGYKDYLSPVISVEYDIIKHDFVMEEDDEKKKDDEKEKEPDKPKEPGKQDDGDKQDEEKGVGQGTDSKTKGDALTQTGESRNLLLTFGGILSMLFGFSLLLYCRKQEAKS